MSLQCSQVVSTCEGSAACLLGDSRRLTCFNAWWKVSRHAHHCPGPRLCGGWRPNCLYHTKPPSAVLSATHSHPYLDHLLYSLLPSLFPSHPRCLVLCSLSFSFPGIVFLSPPLTLQLRRCWSFAPPGGRAEARHGVFRGQPRCYVSKQPPWRRRTEAGSRW